MSPRYPPPAAYSVHLLPVHIALNKAVVFFITPLGEIFIYYRVLSALNNEDVMSSYLLIEGCVKTQMANMYICTSH
jgi:hypothetical protein